MRGQEVRGAVARAKMERGSEETKERVKSYRIEEGHTSDGGGDGRVNCDPDGEQMTAR